MKKEKIGMIIVLLAVVAILIFAIGKNSNVLQIRDIDKKYLDRIDDIIDNTKEVLVYDRSHGAK